MTPTRSDLNFEDADRDELTDEMLAEFFKPGCEVDKKSNAATKDAGNQQPKQQPNQQPNKQQPKQKQPAQKNKNTSIVM